MADYPADLNVSVWNPEGAGKKAMDKEEPDMTSEAKEEDAAKK